MNADKKMITEAERDALVKRIMNETVAEHIRDHRADITRKVQTKLRKLNVEVIPKGPA